MTDLLSPRSGGAALVGLLGLLSLAGACSEPGDTGDPGRRPLADVTLSSTTTVIRRTVSAEGDLMGFGPGSESISGFTVRVLEHPGLETTTDDAGHWRIDGLPAGATATFAIDEVGSERYPIQTATFQIGVENLERVTFQSPSTAIVEGFGGLLGVETDPERCHIASTVTRRGYSLYEGAPDGTHGEPDATVSLDPKPSSGGEPIYFNGVESDLIWPDRALASTTVDGGVLFVNVEPGTYVIRAQKEGAVISDVEVGCRPGVLTNASPPWGLQVTEGGMELDETIPFPQPTEGT